MSRKTAVLICPGRGSYNAPELGYLNRHHADRTDLLAQFDALRAQAGQDSLTDLDGAASFSRARHLRGDNASPLIHACSVFDADRAAEQYDILAVTGNSLGWYIALTVAGGTTPMGGFEIVNTMGTLMHEAGIGGQMIHPFVDEDWSEIPGLRDRLLALVDEINARDGHDLAVSIHLGGMLLVAGNEAGLAAFETSVEPAQGRYPMRLPGHAAFHTLLQAPVAKAGRAALGRDLFRDPVLPLIDGRGALWWPKATDPTALRAYTLGHQVTQPYDFTRAVQVAARSFAPDVFILTGPGSTLGGAIAQALIGIRWQGLDSKQAFLARQSGADPVLVSMGRTRTPQEPST